MMEIAPNGVHDAGGKAKPKWPFGSTVLAQFSACERYRYMLQESWSVNPDRGRVAWLMMNPSVASAEHADPTLIRTGNFSRAWGYSGQIIVNVHAYRATDAKRLLDVEDPVGPENMDHILRAVEGSNIVVLAYGKPPSKSLREQSWATVLSIMEAGYKRKLRYLRQSLDGTPQHPLYLPASLQPLDWTYRA